MMIAKFEFEHRCLKLLTVVGSWWI